MRPAADLTELMDDPSVDPRALANCLRFIRRVNRYLGGTRAVIGHLKKWSPDWPKNAPEPLTFLDVATGSADIPLAILLWARRRQINLHLIALDLHPATLELARRHITKSWPHPGNPSLDFIRGNALALPFANRSIDYVLSSMFMHHLSDDHALAALKEMLRVARRGIIINDLLRSRFARLGIHLLTLFAGPIDKHDARVSVQKAWTRPEVEPWKIAAQAPWLVYHQHIPARFTLAGQRPSNHP